MKKIYVGCALTHASPEFRKEVEDFKDSLRVNYEILDFVGLVKGTEKDVFEWDTQCVKSSDLFIAICDHPSIGLGYEMGVALENKKNILAVAHKDAKVGRIVLGMEGIYGFTFKRYTSSLMEIADYIKL